MQHRLSFYATARDTLDIGVPLAVMGDWVRRNYLFRMTGRKIDLSSCIGFAGSSLGASAVGPHSVISAVTRVPSLATTVASTLLLLLVHIVTTVDQLPSTSSVAVIGVLLSMLTST